MEFKSDKAGMSALLAGGMAAILASTCCIGPLVLVLLGFGGAWVSNLQVLELYRPIFLVVAVVFLGLAYRSIWQPVTMCAVGKPCSVPRTKALYKALFWLVAALIVASVGFPYIASWFY